MLFKGSIVLLDIEGTTTSISFVKDTLFPYISKNVQEHLEKTYDDSQTQEDIAALRKLSEDDKAAGMEGVRLISSEDKETVIKEVVANVKWQMSTDRKTTALKQLQGHMWKKAYEEGEVKGHLYCEVPDCIKDWCSSGIKVCIYSSGSVAAQRLLFGYSEAGDLNKYISGNYDTKIGMKREAESYENIIAELQTEPDQILFLTDITQEADAALEAGMLSCIMERPGNAELTAEQREKHTVLKSFNEIEITTVGKKRKSGSKENLNSVETETQVKIAKV